MNLHLYFSLTGLILTISALIIYLGTGDRAQAVPILIASFVIMLFVELDFKKRLKK